MKAKALVNYKKQISAGSTLYIVRTFCLFMNTKDVSGFYVRFGFPFCFRFYLHKLPFHIFLLFPF